MSPERKGALITSWIGGIGSSFPIFIIGRQIYTYLQIGVWTPEPVTNYLLWIDWIANPKSWFGLHNIITKATNFLSFPILILPFTLIILFNGLQDLEYYK